MTKATGSSIGSCSSPRWTIGDGLEKVGRQTGTADTLDPLAPARRSGAGVNRVVSNLAVIGLRRRGPLASQSSDRGDSGPLEAPIWDKPDDGDEDIQGIRHVRAEECQPNSARIDGHRDISLEI
jgi:hypothetical protein